MAPIGLTKQNLSSEETEFKFFSVLEKILSAIQPTKIYLIGSAAESRLSNFSDLDFVIICKDVEEIKSCKKKLLPLLPLSNIPVDIVWMHQAYFDEMKKKGGIAMIAHEEGKLLFGENS